MALNWNIGEIKDVDLLHNTNVFLDEPPFPKGSDEDKEGDDQWAITDKLIWMTMTLGIGRITEANAEKFAKRLHMYEAINGPVLYKRDENGNKRPMIGYPEIHRRIGLYTNASPLTDAAFRKKLMDGLERESSYAVAYAKEKIKEEAA